MTKTLLALCNSAMDNLVPLGPSLLSACLKKEGHDVNLFDTTFYKTREETGSDVRVKTLQVAKTNLADFGIEFKENEVGQDFRSAVEEYKPDLVGISAVESTYHIALRLLDSIKDIKVPKILGGIHATMAPEEVIKQPNLEMICVGEGEGAIVELADRIKNGRDYSDVKNLWVKRNGKVIKNELRDLVDLDELPFQDLSIYDPKRFHKPMGAQIYVMGTIELIRSCKHKCNFCANAGLHKLYEGKGKYYREKDMDKVMDELRSLKDRYGLEYIYFIAENFLAMNDKRFDRFVELYKDIKTSFYIDTRADKITPEKVRALDKLGCEGVAMGIESGDPKFRREMLNRHISDEKIIEAAKVLKENSDIRVSVNNILGFPTETRDQIFKTIELNRLIDSDYIMVNIFNPYHGTRLREIAIQEGYIPKDYVAGDYRSDAGLDMPQLSRDAIRGLQRTFPLYVRFSRDMWPQIQIAEKFDEKGNSMFEKLSEEYIGKYM